MQKYKVFLNEKRIRFGPPAKITLRKPLPEQPDFSNNREVLAWLNRFEKRAERNADFEVVDQEKAFRNFRASMINMDAAGGVVRRNDKLLFIFRNGKWDLPKGKIDDGESPEIAALREVKEECGLNGHQILKPLPSTYHIYRSPYRATRGEWIFKQTFWFEMENTVEEKPVPQTEEGITEIRWFDPGELDEVLANTYENLRPLIMHYRD